MKTFIATLLLASSFANAATSNTARTTTAKPANDQATQLDDLVRGEQAALKAYDQVLGDLKNEKEKSTLMMIRKDHEAALSKLSKYVAGKKDLLEDTEDAGAWGTFAKSWTKGAGVMGNSAAMKALNQGEEHGVQEYKEALEDKTLSQELKMAIKNEMLPKQEKHIDTLKTLTK